MSCDSIHWGRNSISFCSAHSQYSSSISLFCRCAILVPIVTERFQLERLLKDLGSAQLSFSILHAPRCPLQSCVVDLATLQGNRRDGKFSASIILCDFLAELVGIGKIPIVAVANPRECLVDICSKPMLVPGRPFCRRFGPFCSHQSDIHVCVRSLVEFDILNFLDRG